MDIVGIGTQILECSRVRKLIDRHAELFLGHVYSDREVKYCNGRTHSTEHFTAIWAGKEAVFRSLGRAWRKGMSWHDIEIECCKGKRPKVIISGATRDLEAILRVGSVHLTTAHCRSFATATSVAVRGKA